jgi:hypothetical protein
MAELVDRWNYGASGNLTGDGTANPTLNPYTLYLRSLDASVPLTVASGKANELTLGFPIVNASGASLGLSPASDAGAFYAQGVAESSSLAAFSAATGRAPDLVEYDWEGDSYSVFQLVPNTVWTSIEGLPGNALTRAFCQARSLPWRTCLAYGITELRLAYAAGWRAHPNRPRAIHFYDVGGSEPYQGDYRETMRQIDPLPRSIDPLSDESSDRYRYSTPSIYPLNAFRWYDTVGAGRGLHWLYETRAAERAAGSPFTMPYVAAGWSFDESKNIRPPHWLGFLKVVGGMGALTYMPAFFVIPCAHGQSCSWGVVNDAPCQSGDLVCLTATIQNPNRRAWQALPPSYAQATLSRAEALLRAPGAQWLGELPVSHPAVGATGMRLGSTVLLALAHMPNGTSRYDYQLQGSPVTVGIDHDGSTTTPPVELTLHARVQGSVFLVEFATSPLTVTQLDAWHDWLHPARWPAELRFDAEVFDAASDMVVRSESPGATRGDFTSFVGFAAVTPARASQSFDGALATAPRVELDFEPRGTGLRSYAVWARARTRNASRPGAVYVWADGATSSALRLGCVRDAQWRWVRLDCARGAAPASLSVTAGTRHVLSVAPSHGEVDVDQVVLTPATSCYAAAETCACN